MNELLLHFIETPIFTKRLDKLASMSILFDLQNELIKNPKLGNVIRGTNGARKARIGDKSKNRGKSGAFRYVYVYFEGFGTIYLMFIFAKNEQDNLTDSQKNELAQSIGKIKKELGEKKDGKETF